MQPARERRSFVTSMLLAAAGAYVIFQPWGPPGACIRGLVFNGWQGIRMCLDAAAVPTVTGLAFGMALIALGIWSSLGEGRPRRVADGGLGLVLVAILGWAMFVLATSPTGFFGTGPRP
jgi:hypothetical protein